MFGKKQTSPLLNLYTILDVLERDEHDLLFLNHWTQSVVLHYLTVFIIAKQVQNSSLLPFLRDLSSILYSIYDYNWNLSRLLLLISTISDFLLF